MRLTKRQKIWREIGRLYGSDEVIEDERTVFFNASENIVDIVWEETAGVKHGLNESGNGPDRHVLCMGMSIPL